MSYARIDDLLPHHRKTVAAGKAGPTVLGWYTAAVCYATAIGPTGSSRTERWRR